METLDLAAELTLEEGDAASPGDAEQAEAIEEDKYVVKNQDTGETYDIRDLTKLPTESYSIFPSDFSIAPDDEAVGGCC